MIPELGLFLLIAALALALIQTASGIVRLEALAPVSCPGAALQALCMSLAFAALIASRLDCDFSVANVALHSNLSLPTLYKFTGAWGNHEGSMLLWVWVLSVFGALLAISNFREHALLQRRALAVQGAISAGFLLFILFTSNPFARVFPPPPDGESLNPLLQDIGLAVHPPLLYLGYVGFSIVYALAVAALLEGHMERHWARMAKPWIMASWSLLTLGIALGSWWAYRELGWGGFWFWDPVENASLLPWLSGTALLHANLVLEKRGQLKLWILALAILTFGLSLLGTFLVRSGVLTSVHSFASDPARGLFILGYLTLIIGGAFALFAIRAPGIASEGAARLDSREGMIVVGNVVLVAACGTVLLGTLYPLLAQWLAGASLTVGPPYFNATFIPLMGGALFLAAVAPHLRWRRVDFAQSWKRLQPCALACACVLLLSLALIRRELALACAGLGLATWLALSSASLVFRTSNKNAALPAALAHLGAAVIALGITGASLWPQEVEKRIAAGDTLSIAGYTLAYVRETFERRPEHTAKIGVFILTDAKKNILAELSSEYRRYGVQGTATSEAALYNAPLHDIYAVIGESSPDGRTAARIYYKPLIGFIWLGAGLMALGGGISVWRWRSRNQRQGIAP